MSLDDRLRSAHQRRLTAVEHSLDERGLLDQFQPPPTRQGRQRLVLAAAALALVVGSAAVLSAIGGGSEGRTDVTTAVPVSPGPDDDQATPPSSTTSTREPLESTSESAGSSPTDDPAQDQTTTTTVASDVIDTGVANQVCDTGRRAELERAALRYVSEETGWQRLYDLVDEQDGPFYFLAWEPGYPGTVTVEVVLTQPVETTEIKLAQDPYTEVAGTIEIGVAGTSIPITLSGKDGWRSHVFAEPMVIDRFTVTRSRPESNIMEVLVCVNDQG